MYRKHIVVSILMLGVLLVLTTSRSSAQQPQPPEGNLPDSTAAQSLDMTFTYQGRLQADGAPLDDTCSMAFRLYDDAASGTLIGSPVTTSVSVAEGFFTVGLNFGNSASLFNGDARWLDIMVKCTGDAAYIPLTPRQPLNPAPYALQAAQLVSFNPNNRGASVALSWYNDGVNDWPRIRYGGNGEGSANGLLIQGPSDATRLTLLHNGNVGIGTTGPTARLQVTAGDTQRAIHLTGGTTIISTSLTSKWNLPSSTGGNARLAVISADSDTATGLGFIVGSNVASPVAWMYSSNGRNAFTVARKGYAGTGADISTIDDYLAPLFQVRENGNVGIGTTDPSGALEIRKEDAGVYLNDATDGTPEVALRVSDENFEIVEVEDTTATPQSSLGGQAWITIRDSSSNFYVGIGTTNPQQMLDVAGTARAQVVQITGGSDLAETFEVSGPEPITPGLVVAIDPQRPGALRVSDAPYDRTVAGCISGANGLNPGLVMQQEGSAASGDYPVAVSGRVYCWADASTGPIQPGDLLTTSALPGHLMRVSDYDRAHGAVVGKAMSALEAGQGLVLVLVALQ